MLAMFLFAASSFLAAASPTACLAGKRQALIDGGFTGPLICSNKNATFTFVGRPRDSEYTVYDYRYRFLPHAEGVMHGGQKLVVFRGGKYVGQYPLSPPPYIRVSIAGANVVLRGDYTEPAWLDFSREPPGRILVNGEVETFSR